MCVCVVRYYYGSGGAKAVESVRMLARVHTCAIGGVCASGLDGNGPYALVVSGRVGDGVCVGKVYSKFGESSEERVARLVRSPRVCVCVWTS